MTDTEGFMVLYDASEAMYDVTAHQKIHTHFLPHIHRPTGRLMKWGT